MATTIEQVNNFLPQQPPLLLVDRVLDLEAGKRVLAVKNVTINDYFFQGHFPDNPIMPETLIMEALAQCSILIFTNCHQGQAEETYRYYVGAIKAEFQGFVVPGDQLILEAKAVRVTSGGAFVETKAMVNNQNVVEAEFILIKKK